jgi:SH3-like domain-containing protein
MIKKSFLILSLSVFLFNCGNKSGESNTSGNLEASAGSSDEAKKNFSVCVWNKVALRETPEEKGKYLTSVNLAEKLEFLNETEEDESGSKKREYIKVKLMDGKEGWIIKDFVVNNAQPAVFKSSVEIYARPDLLAKTEKAFSKMDVVAVSETQGDWCKVTGKRSGGTWIDQGWVKSADLSYDEKDLAVSVYTAHALLQSNKEKQAEELQKIVDNKDLEGSVFINDLRDKLAVLNPDPEVNESEIETDSSSTGE